MQKRRIQYVLPFTYDYEVKKPGENLKVVDSIFGHSRFPYRGLRLRRVFRVADRRHPATNPPRSAMPPTAKGVWSPRNTTRKFPFRVMCHLQFISGFIIAFDR